ncbi:uncharacterized protein LOC121776980 [Salvia splendens]|uniref:uncharacterized protein LOC121776980 n=1 Tax=Salvia splendens TaxID=180675 RepID=UPI001C25D9E7|nr:uncharacterized protein LOC121776980 [Salvia splendens]
MPNLEDSYTTKLFDRIHAAIDKLETRLDATNRRFGKLHAPPLPEPPPHQTPNPMYSQRTRRYPPHSQSRPRTPPYTSRPSSYFSPDTYGPQPYSCSDWEQPGVLSDYYEPPHARSISSWYSARQNVYRPPRNAFTSGDQFAEQERPLRQPHCARQSPNSGWSSSESHQQPFLHVKNQTCWDLPSQTSGRRVGKIRAPPLPEHQPQLTPSDRQLQQPSTTSTIELPPYAAPSPCQPLLSMSVKAPLCAFPRQPQAGVSSSRKKEWKIDSHDDEEKREEKLIVLSNVWNQKEIRKENDSITKREDEVNNTFLRVIEKEMKPEALDSSLESKEKTLSMHPEKQSKIERMESLSLVEEDKAAFEIQKYNLEEEMEEKRMLFEDGIRVKTVKLVTKKAAISNTKKILKKRGQSCAFDPGGTLRGVVVLQPLKFFSKTSSTL